MLQKEQILSIIEWTIRKWNIKQWNWWGYMKETLEEVKYRIEQEVSDDDWISVEDMIPDKHWEYLVVDDEVVTTRWWNISDWNNRWLSITHWKPLPLPPSK